jgi:hypothetical protein
MPFVWVRFGKDSLLANLNTGASEWFTLPLALRDRISWKRPPTAGPIVSNNQTGARRVLSGRASDPLWVGPLGIGLIDIYVNADADTPWLGSAYMRLARWTFDPVNQRVEIISPPVQVLRAAKTNGQGWGRTAMAPRTLVAVFAHPDDETIVSPALAQYARQGAKVYVVIATDGRKGVAKHAGIPAGDSLATVRAGEARCSARELGVQPPTMFGLEDAGRR